MPEKTTIVTILQIIFAIMILLYPGKFKISRTRSFEIAFYGISVVLAIIYVISPAPLMAIPFFFGPFLFFMMKKEEKRRRELSSRIRNRLEKLETSREESREKGEEY